MVRRERWVLRRVTLALGLGIMFHSPAWANETETTGIGARASALAGAVTASVADPSAVYYNPAGLTGLKATEAWIDVTSFSIAGDSSNPDTGESFDFNLDPFIVRPTLIVGGPLPWDDLYWAFGVLGVSGLATSFPGEAGENRFAAESAKILQTTLTPAIAWQVNEDLAIGATAEISALTKFTEHVRMGDGFVGKVLAARGIQGVSTVDGRDDARVQIDSDEDFPSGLAPHNDLAADFRSASFVVGATYRIAPFASFGISYKEESEPTMRGEARFLFADDINAATGLPDPETDYESDFTVRPRMVNVGFATEVVDSVFVHAEGQWAQWSANRTLRLDFSGDGLLGQRRLTIPLQWHDTFSPRIGVEKVFASGKRLWLGYWLDKDPVPDRTYFAAFIPGDLHYISMGGLFPSLFGEGVDLGVYGQVGFCESRNLAPGASQTAGGLKNPALNDNGLTFGPNETSLTYEHARVYAVGFTLRIPLQAIHDSLSGES